MRRDICVRESNLREFNMRPYSIALLTVIILAAIVFKIVAVLKAKARRKKEHSIEMVKISTIFRLEKLYTHTYQDPYFCRQLAQAVANEVFVGRACGVAEMQFAKYNARTIQSRLRELQGDTRLIRMLSLSAQVESNLGEDRASREKGAVQPLHHLEKLGLFDSSATALGTNEFERVAKDFYDANGATSKVKN